MLDIYWINRLTKQIKKYFLSSSVTVVQLLYVGPDIFLVHTFLKLRSSWCTVVRAGGINSAFDHSLVQI